jgi:hypothetical protein
MIIRSHDHTTEAPQPQASDQEMREFVITIAMLLLDGEKDDDGEIYQQSISDAFDTLVSVIGKARHLSGRN